MQPCSISNYPGGNYDQTPIFNLGYVYGSPAICDLGNLMTKKETDDINVAIEWFNQDKSRVDRKKAEDKKDDENRCEKSIWRSRSGISKGYERGYGEAYDQIDWGHSARKKAMEQAEKDLEKKDE